MKADTASSYSREVVQSYMLTVAGRDWSMYAEKFLLKLVEIAQCDIKGLNFREGKDTKIHKPSLNYPGVTASDFGGVIVSIPVKELMPEKESHNYTYVRSAIMQLQKEILYWESPSIDSKGNVKVDKNGEPVRKSRSIQLIGEAEWENDKDSFITVRINTDIWNALLDFSKGFRAYDIRLAKKLKSKYSLRIYQLVSRQEYPLTLTIDELKKMWRLGDKYKTFANVKQKILDKAKAELDSCSPWTFEYTFNTQKTGRGHPKIISVNIIPVHQLQFESPKSIVQQNPGAFGHFGLTKEQAEAFKEKFKIDEKGIRNNHELFEKLCKSPLDVDKTIDTLSERVDRLRPENLPGYVINSIRGMLKALGEEG